MNMDVVLWQGGHLGCNKIAFFSCGFNTGLFVNATNKGKVIKLTVLSHKGRPVQGTGWNSCQTQSIKRKNFGPQSFLNVLCIFLIDVAFLCVLILPCFFSPYQIVLIFFHWYGDFLGAFAKLLKTTMSFVMSIRLSVHPSAWNSSAPIEQIFTKFGIWAFFKSLKRKFRFY